MLDPILRPAHRDAEAAGGQRHQHHRREDRRLHPERSARVGRRHQPQPRRRKAQRRGRHTVERERALEVRPGGDRPRRGVPGADDPGALDRRARRSGVAEPAPHDEVGTGQRGGKIAVGEAPVGGDVAPHRLVEDGRPGRQRRLRRRRHRQRVVLDGHELRGVLGHVAVPGHHHRHRLAHVADAVDGRRPVLDRPADGRRERPGQGGDVGTGQHADHARHGQRRRHVDRHDPGVGLGRAHHRRLGDVGQRGEVVHEPALAPEEGVVLHPRHRQAQPRARPGRGRRRRRRRRH